VRGHGGSLVYRRVAHLLQTDDPQRNGRLLLHAAQRHDPQFFELLVSAIGAPAEDDAEFDEPLDGSEAGWVAENAMGVATCGVGSLPAVVLLDHGGGVIVRGAVDGTELGRLPALPGESPLGAAISSVDGETVVVSSNVDGVIRARALQSGRQVVQITSKTKGAPHVLTIIETIREPIIIYGIRNDLEVRHWPSGKEIKVDLSRLSGGVSAVTAGILHGRDTLFVSDGEGALHGRDLASGEAVPVPWRLHSDEIYALAFAPDGNDAVKLFSGDARGVVCGWSASGQLAIAYPGQTTPVVALYAGEIEGRGVLASASRAGRVVVWDINSAETL
jgi:WD40 repeat protein